MNVQGHQQAQEILGTSDVVIITERVDDVAPAILILEINWYRTAMRAQGPGS